MPVRRPLELSPPPPRRLSRVALALSAALHVVLFATLSIEGTPPSGPLRVPRPTVRIIDLPPPAAAPLPLARRGPPAALPAGARTPARGPQVFLPPAAEPQARAAAPDSGAAPGIRAPARIGAGIARGKLWVEPLPLPPRELAQRLTGSHAELVDSAVTAVIQAFLDSVAQDPASRAVALPSWTTSIAGTKFGLDSKYLYIAGLKIPAAVLALLPIPSTGNELKAFDRSGQMYQDLRQAAQRAENVAEFKDAIREIRERTEREREFERNQRSEPPRGDTPVLERETPDQ
jgi:hypothetical protein